LDNGSGDPPTITTAVAKQQWKSYLQEIVVEGFSKVFFLSDPEVEVECVIETITAVEQQQQGSLFLQLVIFIATSFSYIFLLSSIFLPSW
jgi:hypothetical protein